MIPRKHWQVFLFLAMCGFFGSAAGEKKVGETDAGSRTDRRMPTISKPTVERKIELNDARNAKRIAAFLDTRTSSPGFVKRVDKDLIVYDLEIRPAELEEILRRNKQEFAFVPSGRSVNQFQYVCHIDGGHVLLTLKSVERFGPGRSGVSVTSKSLEGKDLKTSGSLRVQPGDQTTTGPLSSHRSMMKRLESYPFAIKARVVMRRSVVESSSNSGQGIPSDGTKDKKANSARE